MSTVQILKCLVNQRLAAAVEEVFEMFERTIADYEEKLRRSREENHRQQKLLSAVYNPEIRLETADVEQLMVRREEEEEVLSEQQESSSSLNQEITEPPPIKEEQEDLWRDQEREQLQHAEKEENLFRFTPISVKSEEEEGEDPQSSQSGQTRPEESRDTEDVTAGVSGEDCGGSEADQDFSPDWYFLPATPDRPPQLFRADAYQSGEWVESDEPQEGSNPLQSKGVAVNIPVTFNALNASVSSGCAPNVGRKQKRKEKGEKPYRCPVCGKNYPGKNNLKEHMLRHAAEKPFSCSVCNRSFIKKTELVTHMRSHTGEKPYQCSVCGKRFTQSGSLTTHFVIHSGVKPFSCSVCGKSFSQRGGLKQHSAVHTTEKLFSCSFCENTFQSRADFVKHMRAHEVEKPFSCSVCGKGFYQYCNMKQHEVMHIRDGVQLQGLS